MAINGFKADGTTYRYNAEALEGYAPIEDGSVTMEKLDPNMVANDLTTTTSGSKLLDAAQGKALSDMVSGVHMSVVELLKTGVNVPTTATSYSCAWSGYDLLIMCIFHYSNIRTTLVIPRSYFGTANSGSRPITWDNHSGAYWQMYPNGDNAVYIVGGVTNESYNVRVYGIKV